MLDYQTAVERFDLQRAVDRDLHGSLEALNACVECCDRHLGQDRVALYQESEDGHGEQYTFEQLSDAAGRFATVLADRGVGAGDRVAGLLPRRVELLITVLATWRLGAVYQPLFTAFGLFGFRLLFLEPQKNNQAHDHAEDRQDLGEGRWPDRVALHERGQQRVHGEEGQIAVGGTECDEDKRDPAVERHDVPSLDVW